MTNNAQPLLTIAEAAGLLNVSKATIRRWTDEGRLACLRIGARKERRFRHSDLAQMMEEPDQNQNPTSAEVSSQPCDVAGHAGHQCIVSDTLAEEWDTLGAAILAALDAGSQVLVIVTPDRRERLEHLLASQGRSMPALLAEHRLLCVSVEESYLLSGAFRWDRAVAYIESAILAAQARGFETILIIGANAGQAETDGDDYAREMKSYELGLDAMLSRYPGATVLCPYTAEDVSAQLMVQGFLTHPVVRVRGTQVDGFLGQFEA